MFGKIFGGRYGKSVPEFEAELKRFEKSRDANAQPSTAEKFKKRLEGMRDEQQPEPESTTLFLFLIHAGDDTPDDADGARREFTAGLEDIRRLRRTENDDLVLQGVLWNLRNAYLLKSDLFVARRCLRRVAALIALFELPQLVVEFCIAYCVHAEYLDPEDAYEAAEQIARLRVPPGLTREEMVFFRDRLLREPGSGQILQAFAIQQLLSE